MVWLLVLAGVVMAAIMMWAYTGMGSSLGVYKEDQRLNDEADAREAARDSSA
jgi:hypothetical protein